MSAAAGADGLLPLLTSGDLIAAVPELDTLANYTAVSLAQVGSANLSFEHVAQIIDYAEGAEINGADAIVITQGTDTLEEMAFITSRVWDGEISIVFTAAMRHPASDGADGPANLLAAVQVACSVEKDVYVVMNGEIHDPSWVRKCHTTALDAFQSENGPIGTVMDGQVKIPKPLSRLPRINKARLRATRRVAILTPTFSQGPWQVDAAEAEGFDGYVVAGYGGGHVSESWAEKLKELAKVKPVILASRIGKGRILTSTYGYKGAEMDLIEGGLVPSGRFDAIKARLSLCLLLDVEREELIDFFQQT